MAAVLLQPSFRRKPLYAVRHFLLERTLAAWRRIADRDGCFDYSKDITPIFTTPHILLPSSTLILATEDGPCDWIYGWYGAGVGAFNNRSLVGRRVRDMPAPDAYTAAAAECLATAVGEADIAYHQVTAFVDGRVWDYERLILPLKDCGKVSAVVTTSVSPDFPFVRDGSWQRLS